MNVLNSLFNRFLSVFRKEPSVEIITTESTPLKRRKNENVIEDMPIKRRKPNIIPSLKDGNDIIASPYFLRRQPFGVGSKENSRFNSRTLKILNIAVMKNNAAPDNHKIYSIDSDDEECLSNQKNVTSRNEGQNLLKDMNKNPELVTVDLSKDDISSDPKLSTPTCLTDSVPLMWRNTGIISPELCLNKIQRQKDEAVFVEMVLRSGQRKSIPLTNSAVHNTKQNKQTVSDASSNGRYSLRHQQLPVVRKKVSSPKIDLSVPERNAAIKAIIDLTEDDDDDAQRQEIQSNVASSSDIRNLKSDFVAEDSFMLDPDLCAIISKKYENSRRDYEKRASALKKELYRHRKDFHQALSDIIDKRLTLKEVTTSEKEVVDDRPCTEIVPFTNEMMVKINEILASKKCPLVQIKDTAVKLQDIRTLENRCWLNDEIINAYMNLIKLRAEKNPKKYPKVYCFNTFLYEQLSKKGYSAVRRWTRRIDIFDFEIIIVPIHLKNHWCLTEIRFNEKVIKYYDSMGSPNTRCLKTMLEYLEDEHEDKKNGTTFDTSNWQLVNVPIDEIPQQQNAHDCGVFACTYAEHLTRNASFNFDQQDMHYFRLKMMYEILTGELLL